MGAEQCTGRHERGNAGDDMAPHTAASQSKEGQACVGEEDATRRSRADVAEELGELARSFGHRAFGLATELKNRAESGSYFCASGDHERRDEVRNILLDMPLEIAECAYALLDGDNAYASHRTALVRAAADKNLQCVLGEVARIAHSLESETSRKASADEAVARHVSVERPPDLSGTGIVWTVEKMKQWIRQQVKAEGKTNLTDDILVAAYRQCGSMRAAAKFLTKETGKTVSKDKVHRAVNRSGGVQAVRRAEDSDSIQRTVASQRRDRQEKYSSPSQPPEIE